VNSISPLQCKGDYSARLAAGEWAVTFGTARRILGAVAARPALQLYKIFKIRPTRVSVFGTHFSIRRNFAKMFNTYKTRMIGLPFGEETITIGLC